jgi:L-ascorbate metabolism protein UlaG (beta-lactamase superfamily)
MMSHGATNLQVTWLGHATVLLELDGVRVLTDPVLHRRVGPLVRIVAPVDLEAVADVDCVLLSHLHADHVDLGSLRRLGDRTPVVAPAGAAAWLRGKGMHDVRELAAGEDLQIGALPVRAVPAVHESRRHPFGTVAQPVGYLVGGARTAYFAGDTDLYPGMSDLRGRVDVALLPVWGWGPSVAAGHLDPERAARAAATIAPRVAIPIHWGTLALPRWLRRGHPDRTAPAMRFAALAAQSAPEVEVRVLEVGEHTSIAAG